MDFSISLCVGTFLKEKIFPNKIIFFNQVESGKQVEGEEQPFKKAH